MSVDYKRDFNKDATGEPITVLDPTDDDRPPLRSLSDILAERPEGVDQELLIRTMRLVRSLEDARVAAEKRGDLVPMRRWAQGDWFHIWTEDDPVCETGGCFCGWALVDAGATLIGERDNLSGVLDGEDIVPFDVAGQALLGLNADQATELFAGNNAIDDLEAIVMEIIFGEQACDHEGCPDLARSWDPTGMERWCDDHIPVTNQV
jgi:hypothetical protein